MDTAPASEITDLLASWRGGDEEAGALLIDELYPLLRREARGRLARWRGDVTLQPTEIVHELYLKLSRSRQPEWADRAHFLAISARLMREILVDHARRRSSLKRGGETVHLPLDENDPAIPVPELGDLLAVDEALEKLGDRDPVAAELVLLRFFGGLEIREAASVLQVSSATLVRKWRYARAWLRRELKAAPQA